jgi:hypothetical protein
LVPSWWHAVQPPDFKFLIQSAWLLMFGEMPLPPGALPGNSLFSGTRISESQ